jgi:hypothetical protein
LLPPILPHSPRLRVARQQRRSSLPSPFQSQTSFHFQRQR